MLRAPHLDQHLRAFCLATFAVELPFAFEERATRDGPSLLEYRPLVRGFVEEQAPALRRLPDARGTRSTTWAAYRPRRSSPGRTRASARRKTTRSSGRS